MDYRADKITSGVTTDEMSASARLRDILSPIFVSTENQET